MKTAFKIFSFVLILALAITALPAAAVSAEPVEVNPGMQAAADRLVELQNADGGWGWPLTGASASNTIGPIGMGLAQAYRFTTDADHLTALGKVGTFLLTKVGTFSPSDGYLAAQLDAAFGGTTYRDYVNANFYDLLAAGTYYRTGDTVAYDAAAYVARIRTNRSGSQANMAAWDIGLGLVGAAACGADTSAWIAGVKAEIDELDSSAYYDVIGLAGALYGLAYVGEEFDPTAGSHAAAANLADLAAILATYQIEGGGFAWNSAYVIPNDGNETIQETAYAVMALNEVNRALYLSSIRGAADYMLSVQLGTGGWENYPGSGENNEVSAEGTWAIAAAYPYPEVWVCLSGNCGHPGFEFSSIQAGINAVDPGGIVHLAAETFSESLGGWRDLEISKSLSLVGAGKGQTVVEFTGLQHGLEIRPDATGEVTVEGITFTKKAGNTLSAEWGIIVGETGGTFNSLVFRDVDMGYSSARNIHLNATATYNNLVVEDCDIHHSDIWGMSIAGPADGVTISGSNFSNNGFVDPVHGDGLFFANKNIQNVTVTNSTFNDNAGSGINIDGLKNAVFDGITANHNGNFNGVIANNEMGINLWDFTGPSQNIVIKNSTFAYNERAAFAFGNQTSGAGLDDLEITANTIIGNGHHAMLFWFGASYGDVSVHHNRIIHDGTAESLIGLLSGSLSLADNWWGCNEGFGQPGCSSGVWTAAGSFTFPSWLVMNVTDLPANSAPLATAAFDADLRYNNLGADTSASGYLPATTLVGFTPTANVDPDSDLLTDGVAGTTFTAPVLGGTATEVCAVLDNETVCDTTTTPTATDFYVDDAWVGYADGTSVTPNYPAGASAATFGFNAFAAIQPAVDAAAEGAKIYVAAGSYTESVSIATDRLKLLLQDGATLTAAGNACFLVEADYTRILGEPYGAAKCIPTGGYPGVYAPEPINDFVIEWLEFDGTGQRSGSGIYLNGGGSDIVIANNYMHDLTADGIPSGAIDYYAPITGTFDIQGNMFEGTAGITDMGNLATNAEFNSWGDYNVTEEMVDYAGFGAIDFDPWTHVDLYLGSSGTPWADQVVEGQTITYAVYGNLRNVMGAQFDLKLPTGLTVDSTSLGTVFSNQLDLTVTNEKINFAGWQMEGADPVTGQNLPLFTVTFSAPAAGSYALDLDDTNDVFSMAPGYGPSTNIFAYALLDASVEVVDLPTMEIVPLPEGSPDPCLAGLPCPFQLHITNPLTGMTPTEPWYLDFTVPTGAVLEVYDDITDTWVVITDPANYVLGGVNPNGVTITPTFRITFVDPGSNVLTVDLMDPAPDTDFLLATDTETFNALGNFTVTGTFSMQGRSYRGDIPVTLTKVGAPAYGPYPGWTVDEISDNLTILNVNAGTYLVTTLQPRYLNIPASMNKTINVTGDYELALLPTTNGNLKGGNAVWVDNYIINAADAVEVGGKFGTGTIADDADVNFDNVVNVQDLSLVGGNFDLRSMDGVDGFGDPVIGVYTAWVP